MGGRDEPGHDGAGLHSRQFPLRSRVHCAARVESALRSWFVRTFEGGNVMIRKLLLIGLLFAAAGAAQPQPATTPSPYARIPDRPTSTSAELKAATDAY